MLSIMILIEIIITQIMFSNPLLVKTTIDEIIVFVGLLLISLLYAFLALRFANYCRGYSKRFTTVGDKCILADDFEKFRTNQRISSLLPSCVELNMQADT
jgi:hypothetical protein